MMKINRPNAHIISPFSGSSCKKLRINVFIMLKIGKKLTILKDEDILLRLINFFYCLLPLGYCTDKTMCYIKPNINIQREK